MQEAGCGLGAELTVLLPLLIWLRRRKGRIQAGGRP
jgi:hypothetical protein